LCAVVRHQFLLSRIPEQSVIRPDARCCHPGPRGTAKLIGHLPAQS
jgi:hypothetical protein